MITRLCLKEGLDALRDSDIEDYAPEARLLLQHVLKVNRAKLVVMYSKEMPPKLFKKYMKLIKERQTHKPLAYILKKQKFMDLDFFVNKNVLIPRDDTEVLVRKAIELFSESKNEINILDVCSGSGCISISLAHYLENSNVIGLDISRKAIKVSNKNNRRHKLTKRVKYIKSDLFSKIDNKKYYKSFDLIVSNPPYIKTEILKTLERDVIDFEPILALDGGEDGLTFYEKIIKQSGKFLKKGGIIIFEIDYTYGNQISEMLKLNNFEDIEIIEDISGKDRVVKAKLK